MKRYIKIGLLIAVTLITNNTFAETFISKIDYSSDNYNYNDSYNYNLLYQNLDLHQLDSIEVTAVNSEDNLELELSSLKLVFPNATDLVVSSFSRVDSTYTAIVQNAWVIRQLMVEVVTDKGLFEGNKLTARVYVVELSNNLNNTDLSSYIDIGPKMLDISGTLVDLTANTVADEVNINVDGKNLNLRLYQRPASKVNGQGFVIDANWFGHGEAGWVVSTPFSPVEYLNFKAVSITVDSLDGGMSLPYNITYKDQDGKTSSVKGDLRLDFDQAFPPMP